MKNIYIACIILLLCSGQIVSSGQASPKVDERIELTCAVFRLANIPEFNQGLIDEYNRHIDSCFKDFRFSDLSKYIINLRNKDKLGYSAVVGSAMYLQIDGGAVKVNDDMDLSSLPGLGSQWRDTSTFREYVNLLDDFYKKSEFHSFFESHFLFYDQAEAGMADVLQYLNPDWFTDFFNNEQSPALGVYVAPGLGPNNYFILGGSDMGYSIVIGARPVYQFDLLEMIVHETCHYYSNPLFYQYWPHMEKAAYVMYPYASDMVASNGYGSAQETFLEWQNCLFSLMYYRDNIDFFLSKMPEIAGIDIDFGNIFVSPVLQVITEKGFIWMPRSVDFMENFYNNRDIYPHIEDFMPQLVRFLDNAAEKYGQIIFEYEHRRPYVTDVFPVSGSNLLDVPVDEVRIVFSKPMAKDIYSLGGNLEDTTFRCLPYRDAYFADEHTFVIEFDRSKLEKDKKYRLQFNGSFFCDSEYNKMGSDYVITYTTECKNPDAVVTP